MTGRYPGVCEVRRKRDPSYLVYHPQRNKTLPTIADYSLVYTFDARIHAYDACVYLYSGLSHACTRRALSRGRSLAPLLACREQIRDFSRSCRRSVPTVRSGGPARERPPSRTPRRSRSRSIDRIVASARSPKCPPILSPGKTPFNGAHTCLCEAEDERVGFVIR